MISVIEDMITPVSVYSNNIIIGLPSDMQDGIKETGYQPVEHHDFPVSRLIQIA